MMKTSKLLQNATLPRRAVRLAMPIGACAAVMIGYLCWTQSTSAQVFAKKIAVAGGFGATTDDEPKDAAGDAASLENDPEIERLLHRASQALEDNRFDLSATLLQKVLD